MKPGRRNGFGLPGSGWGTGLADVLFGDGVGAADYVDSGVEGRIGHAYALKVVVFDGCIGVGLDVGDGGRSC